MVQTGYDASLRNRDKLKLSNNPNLSSLTQFNQEIVDAVKTSDPAKMKPWGTLVAFVVGLRVGELSFIQWGVDPLVALGDQALARSFALRLAVLHRWLCLGCRGVILALWFWLDKATDAVRDALDAYRQELRAWCWRELRDSVYRYYETRLDLLFRQKWSEQLFRQWKNVDAEYRHLQAIDDSLRIQIQRLESMQEAIGVIINRDGSEQLAGLLDRDDSVLRAPGIDEAGIRHVLSPPCHGGQRSSLGTYE